MLYFMCIYLSYKCAMIIVCCFLICETKMLVQKHVVYSSYSIFQCGFQYIRPGDELLHYFTHHIMKTEDELREIMRSKMIQHIDWLHKISKIVLKDVNVSLEDYIDTITTPGVPLDFVALMALCHFYHFHVAVFTTVGVWSTARETKKNNCLFGVVYHGNFTFSETVGLGRGDAYREFLEKRRKDGKLPSHNRNCMPGSVKMESTVETLSDALNIVNNNVICKHGRDGQDRPDNETVCKVKQEFNIPDYRKMITNVLVKQEKDCPQMDKSLVKTELSQREGPVEETQETQQEVVQTSETQHVKREPVQYSPDLDSDTSEDTCEILRCDETLAYSDPEDSKINFLWDAIATSVADAKAAVSAEAQCPDNVQDSAETGCEVVERKDVLLQCPMCLLVEKSQKRCIEHISKHHPEYRYKCCYCSKDFSNFHTRYRHERDHEGPKVYCDVCGDGYQFSSELARHATVHNTVLPFPCDACTKRFASEKSLRRHKNVHNEQEITCEVCAKVSTTPERHYSHFRGAHGTGYKAKCGKVFQWPASRARHYEVCDTCKEILAQEAAAKLKRKKPAVTATTSKKFKAEAETETLEDTKQTVQLKLENISQLKKEANL